MRAGPSRRQKRQCGSSVDLIQADKSEKHNTRKQSAHLLLDERVLRRTQRLQVLLGSLHLIRLLQRVRLGRPEGLAVLAEPYRLAEVPEHAVRDVEARRRELRERDGVDAVGNRRTRVFRDLSQVEEEAADEKRRLRMRKRVSEEVLRFLRDRRRTMTAIRRLTGAKVCSGCRQ